MVDPAEVLMRAIVCTVAAFALALGAGCAGYTDFSSHESARLLAPGKLAVSGAASGAHWDLRNDPLAANGWAIAGEVRRGATAGVELGLRVSHLRWEGDFPGHNTLVYVDTKLSLVPDELAIVLPLGIGLGGKGDDNVHHLQLAPALVHTATLSRTVELDSSVRIIVASDETVGDFGVLSAAATVGVRLRSDWWRLEWHPEIGVMVDDLTHEFAGMPPNEIAVGDSLTVGFSIGVTWLP